MPYPSLFPKSLSSRRHPRFSRFAEIGCVCCRRLGHKNGEVEVHHLVEGRKRLGDNDTIPLCAYHHRGVTDYKKSIAERVMKASRHLHGRRLFEQQWGSEKDLLAFTNELLNA